MKYKKLISIIVPMHNEGSNIRVLYDELVPCLYALPFSFELIFVDDGSSDDSAAQIEDLMRTDKRVRLIELARNFGKEPAVTAGLHHAKGQAALIMDADLQHPPSLIKDFIAKWQQGADVVVGVKHYAKDVARFKRYTSVWFYRLLQMVAQTEVTPHASDFRLIDRIAINAFNGMTERNRLNRGMIDWLGFRRDYVYFEQPKRVGGTPSYTYRKLVGLAINAFTSYSMMPLKLAGYLGGAILFLAMPASMVFSVNAYILHDPMHLHMTGTALIAMMLLILVGVMLVCLGLVAHYIGNIYAEVTNRPLYVVRRHKQALPVTEIRKAERPKLKPKQDRLDMILPRSRRLALDKELAE